jgi:hypothetical protein
VASGRAQDIRPVKKAVIPGKIKKPVLVKPVLVKTGMNIF